MNKGDTRNYSGERKDNMIHAYMRGDLIQGGRRNEFVSEGNKEKEQIKVSN